MDDFKKWLDTNKENIREIVSKNPISISKEELNDEWDDKYDNF